MESTSLPLMWELLLNLSIKDLKRRCRGPQDNIVKGICNNEEFWKAKVEKDFGLQPSEPNSWKNLYDQLIEDKLIETTTDDIIEIARDDVYVKRKQIVDLYNQKLHDQHRDPTRCRGVYEKTIGVEAKTKDIDKKNAWMLIMGPEGEKMRENLVRKDIALAFSNYYKGNTKAKIDMDYYGVIFIGLTYYYGNYVYGTPDTIKNEEELKVFYPYKDPSFDGSNVGDAFNVMPSEINILLHKMFKHKVEFIKLYMFISPPELDPDYEIDVMRRKEGLEVEDTPGPRKLKVEDFMWVLNDGQRDFKFNVTLEYTKYFITSILYGDKIDDTVYPIVIKTSTTGCRKKKCGPWIK